ncbi:hypothetical protein IW139_000004 [Coemansia sp. RSA 353]|nr:hypothetical protein IW145_000005 [Coemansia sp. RSA 521]KAJ2284343.1 hypothetical protein GGH14_000222 [Coemansia sp. RSA 370]KAJ2301788.1 hypothetical protein IW139_000004 [Coemansia sp. RSA 353]
MQMWVSRYLVKLRGKAIKYTDKRIRTTRETLQGIKVVKAYAWESSILETMQRIRDKEVGIIARLNLVRYSLISVALHSPVFASILTFAALVLTGGKLKNSAVFATIGIFNSMSVPLSWFPGALTETINTLVPLRRIAEALLEEELVCASDPCQDLDVAVRISDGDFKWNDGAAIEVSNQKGNDSSDALKVSQEVFQLKAVNLEIPHGSLVIVIGSVGSGKSSLASAIVGEMDCTSGSIIYGGTLGYAPQVPWMTNATIRENIVFGKPFDYETYLSVIEACELEADLAAFPAGDQTEIGERGVTLSGGQKQRISIARTAYAECNISVLDDCLSAVDVRTSRAIFKQCIRGFLASTTRILVTNSLDYLPTADLVITMDNGQVVESGTFLDLMEMGGVTAAIYASFMSHENSEYFEVGKSYTTDSSLYTATPIRETARSSKSSGRSAQLHVSNIDGEKQSALTFASLAARTEISELPDMEATSSGSSQKSTNRMSDLNVADDKELSTNTVPIESSNTHARKLMSQEERETGQISWSIYRTYIQAGGGNIVLAGILLCLVISQGCRVGSDFWMRLWIHHRRDSSETKLFVGLYALLGGLQFLWFGLFSALLVLSVYKSSKKLHAQAFERVLRSPMSFFDTTPLGRILNRFTRDIDSLDLALCDFFRQFYQNIGRSASAFVTISILVPVFLVALVPLLVASWGLIYVYLRTSVEIQRVAAISRSPLYAHYTETLQGLSTIRAYRAQERYIAQADFMLDNANRPHWYSLAVQSWIWLRVDYLSHLLTLVICLIIVAQPTRWDAAAVGLMLVQATQMGAYATYAGRGWSELQNNMNSVERVSYYATMLDKEDTLETNATKCAVSSTAITMRPITAMWPERGTVIVRNLSMRYRPELPLALQGVDMEIYSGEKIGIVGRSGAGKSSLVTALFRLVEPASGKIFIDGIDTQCVPLDRLRKAIGILPQDSVLFEGSVRSNLDLFHEYSDTAAWDILRQVCMYDLVSQHPQKLDMMVGEGGENFSAGQRQLLCLARALLRKPKILVLDEATANVDHETDAAIQRAISLTGQHMTVISIAHRLQTVVTYDKIFVVDDGRIVESGTPLSLLEQYTYSASSFENTITASQSPFYGMIREMNSAAVESLLAQASKKSK